MTCRASSDYQLNIFIVVGINGCRPESLEELQKCRGLLTAKGFSYSQFLHPRNLGKPESINTLVKTACNQISLDYIVSYDSDMVVTDPEWLLKFVEIYERYRPEWGHSKLGALSGNQKEKCCHVLDKDPFTITFGNYHLVSRAGNEGVAGGVLFIPRHIWDVVGGYHAHRIYASDDGHFMLACAQLGLICPVVQEVSFIHPHETDTAYLDWKVRACQDQLLPHEQAGFWK
jgi:glycosyltransferase involved in cell wall biosynthesis